MRGLAGVILTLVWLASPAGAAPHKILVLPTDGTADPATRAKLTAQIVKLSKGLEGQVATAEATFADTALAVGCDPQARGCSDEVLATLGVDELVWATATKDGAQTKVVVRRATKGTPTRQAVTTLAAGDPADRINARMATAMAPVFGSPGTAPEPAGPTPGATTTGALPAGTGGAAPDQVPPAGPADDPRDRNLGIAFAAGGGVALVLGLALWASYASLQDSIDGHPTANRSDFDDLTALEDRAARYAIAGDCLVIAGLAAGGLGAYYLYRNHNRHRIAILPAPIGNGAGLTLTILGGL